jgi:hypothetical protein
MSEWFDEDPGSCPWCDTKWEWVRPGKSQPLCDCNDFCRAHELPVRCEWRSQGNPQGFVCPACWPVSDTS